MFSFSTWLGPAQITSLTKRECTSQISRLPPGHPRFIAFYLALEVINSLHSDGAIYCTRHPDWVVDVQLLRAWVESCDEHWSLLLSPRSGRDKILIGAKAKSKVYQNTSSGFDPDAVLTASKTTWRKIRNYTDFIYVPLFEARWFSKEEFEKTVSRLIALEAHVPPRNVGGNCMDFVDLMLRVLKLEGAIQSSRVFDNYKSQHYDKVYRQTWVQIVKQDKRLSRRPR